jgi:hypothetical protein
LESQLSILYQCIDNQKQKVIDQIDGKMDMLNTSAQDLKTRYDRWMKNIQKGIWMQINIREIPEPVLFSMHCLG